MIAFVRTAVAVSALALSTGAVFAQADSPVAERYTKREVRIRMRDGAELFTAIYAPKDTSKPYPILINRTPYSVGPYGPDAYKSAIGPSPRFMDAGYIVVYQDVRGRWMSQGEFVDMRPHVENKRGTQTDESSDTYDTIDWLVKNVPNNNGKVGLWGISYPGFYTSAGAIDSHPALTAISPQAPITDWFIGDDFHHNGALFLPHGFLFLSGFGQARPEPTTTGPSALFSIDTNDGYDFFLKMGPLANADARYYKGKIAFWNQMMAHPNYDAFWQARNLRPHLKNIKAAVLTVGGWFDAEDLFGALETYKRIKAQNPGIDNRLVMGPWVHGGWSRGDGDQLGSARFGAKTSVTYRDTIEFPFFEHWLKGAPLPASAEATVFDTGANAWSQFESWPPKEAQAQAFYLAAGRTLSASAPTVREGFDSYVSDPAHPVPFTPYKTLGMSREYMTDDQRFAAQRPDVLTYRTEPLAADLTAAGPLRAELKIASTGTDADFVVKVIDEFPGDAPEGQGGYLMLVRGEPMRARFRKSYTTPQPLTPGKIETVAFTLPDIFHTFKKGHRLVVQVQSSWFPLADRNPQTFVANINQAAASDFVAATQTLYRSRAAASRLVLTVLPARR